MVILGKRGESVLIVIVFALLLFAIVPLVSMLSENTGRTVAVNTSAGTITVMDIVDTDPTGLWHGVYGIALRFPGFFMNLSGTYTAGGITFVPLYFDCIQDDASGGKEIYAATVPNVDFSNVRAGTIGMVDAFLNYTGYPTRNKSDSAANTFMETMDVYIGSNVITNVPATHTYKYNGDNDVFDIGILNFSGLPVMVTHIQDPQYGFDPGMPLNFQMMLPIPENQSQAYYYFTDPNDECPLGGLGNLIEVRVSGYTFDQYGKNISGATVTIGGYSTLTDALGFYNYTVLLTSGTYRAVAQKAGYEPNVSSIAFSFSSAFGKINFTLRNQRLGDNLTVTPRVFGNVIDTGGTFLAEVNISMGGSFTLSDAEGNYSFNPTVALGTHYIIALYPGYMNYVGNITIAGTDAEIEHNIMMEPIPSQQIIIMQYVTGPYVKKPVQVPIVQPRVEQPLKLEYFIPTKLIKKKIRQNTFIDEPVYIFNFKKVPLTVNIEKSDSLGRVMEIDREQVIVGPDSVGMFIVRAYGIETLGDYNGTIILTGDISDSIPVEISVVENKLPIELLLIDIELLSKRLTPGSPFKYRVGLQNLLMEQGYQVKLRHSVIDALGKAAYASEEEDVEIRTTANLIKELKLPDNIPEGEYVLRIDASYLNLTSTASAKFVVSRPIYLLSVFGIPLWHLSLMLAGLLLLLLLFYYFRQYREKKKRYHLKVDMSEMPKAGPGSIFIGRIAETTYKTYIELDKLKMHAIVAGATGRGKTIAAQDVVEEALMKNVAVIVVDPTAQWSGMLRKCTDKKMMSFYPKFGLKAKDARAFNGNVRYIQNALEKNKHKENSEARGDLRSCSQQA
ncbi:MAG: DUF87 domain-containing protein [Candidatus Woesearchaeota archaeon]